MTFVESEYEDFSMIISSSLKLGDRAYIHDTDDDAWYIGHISAVKKNEDPINLDGDYTGEFILSHGKFAVGIDVEGECGCPEIVEDLIVEYC